MNWGTPESLIVLYDHAAWYYKHVNAMFSTLSTFWGYNRTNYHITSLTCIWTDHILSLLLNIGRSWSHRQLSCPTANQLEGNMEGDVKLAFQMHLKGTYQNPYSKLYGYLSIHVNWGVSFLNSTQFLCYPVKWSHSHYLLNYIKNVQAYFALVLLHWAP